MDLVSLSNFDLTKVLKMLPAVIGIAGILTYLTRKPQPASDLELVNYIQNLRNIFLLIGCAALILLSVWLFNRPPPPDREAGLRPDIHALLQQN